jgi:hypothetical protein
VRLWEADGTAGPAITRRNRFPALALTSDGQHLAAGMTSDVTHIGTVRQWQADGQAGPILTLGPYNSALSVAWHPDGKRLAVGGSRGIRLWGPTGMRS